MRIFYQTEDTVIFYMMKKCFACSNYLSDIFSDDCHFFNKICSDNMKSFDFALFNFIWSNNDTILCVFFKSLENFLIIFMQLIHRNKLRIPSIKFHYFLIIIYLIFSEVQPFCLKGIINAGLILGNKLPICDW